MVKDVVKIETRLNRTPARENPEQLNVFIILCHSMFKVRGIFPVSAPAALPSTAHGLYY
jgi:hypothetical protein